jgi:hypothetical protein
VKESIGPNLACLGISTNKRLMLGDRIHFVDTLALRNEVTAKRAGARFLIASAEYKSPSGRTTRVECLRWLEHDAPAPSGVRIEMGQTGNLILAGFTQNEQEFKCFAFGFDYARSERGNQMPHPVLYGLQQGPITVIITVLGEGVTQRYRCEGTISPKAVIDWKEPVRVDAD